MNRDLYPISLFPYIRISSNARAEDAKRKEQDGGDEFEDHFEGQANDGERQEQKPHEWKEKKHDQCQGPTDHQEYAPKDKRYKKLHGLDFAGTMQKTCQYENAP